ncbi:MAG: helix-turn-helix domain-containing protein [Oscillospiraceae bacterium]|nr:helix-turn-helix domain-containing protein [Oscillospiraceae bacterium]
MQEKLYTKKQACEYLQCSLSTINRRIKTGELKTLKNGRIVRIAESELDKLLIGNTQSNSIQPEPIKKKTIPLPANWLKK